MPLREHLANGMQDLHCSHSILYRCRAHDLKKRNCRHLTDAQVSAASDVASMSSSAA